ncbi:hypothetical protein [Algoriphagus sp.]|uniref:hypothetical protein n=1 Tax=Algoriphagus sp. TaxID=1872435 RepID=UPI0026283E5E|nr:hypothetical protein [Algoriphagus sp.]
MIMIQRNKGDTQRLNVHFSLEANQASKIKEALIRTLDRILVQETDQEQLNDIREIYKLLEYFSEPVEKK